MATSQLRITIPTQIQNLLLSKSDQYGLTMSAYVKNLIINDVKQMEISEVEMSSRTEKTAIQALQDHTKGETHTIDDIGEFLASA